MARQSEYMQRNPVRLDISRSRFHMAPRWTGAFDAYKLVPIFTYTDILPGDTFKLSTSFVVRMSTPVAPVMDDLFLDVAFYFVPHELILSRSYMSPSTNDSNHSWKAFIGAQDSLLNMPVPDSDVELPHALIYGNNYAEGGIVDCMGIPQFSGNYYINALAPLAFMAVWNENYRDPNVQNPGVFSITSNQVGWTWAAAGLTNGSYLFSSATLPNVCRLHGYFGSALPWPQRNSETITMPLGISAPVIDGGVMHDMGNGTNGIFSPSLEQSGAVPVIYGGRMVNETDGSWNLAARKISVDGETIDDVYRFTKTSLVADLANASAVSINTFRLAVQEQRWYEALARGGNRIDELTAALFGVMPKDAGGNQPEYLGGKRIPLNVTQVNVTANSEAGSQNNGVGNTGAFSLTSDVDYYFTKSFDRWGSIIGVACVRYRDSFGRSLNRMFTRHERFDFYFPQFANLGEQPVYRHEADVMSGNSSNGYLESDVFGYQEAWADYRYIPDVVTGLVRPGKSLQHWTYANGAVGTLAQFLTGQGSAPAVSNIDRSLVVGSSTAGFQFLGQFQFDITAVRPMPLYSIPGLVDHH